jgi:hypothetical protein
MSVDPTADQIQVEVLYGAHTQRGLVQLMLPGQTVQMTPSKAREIAAFLLEAAGAAEGDEAMMVVLGRTSLPDNEQIQFLMALRAARAQIDQRSRAEARAALAFDQRDPDRLDP